MEITVIVGRARALKLADELRETFTDTSISHPSLTLYAKNNSRVSEDADVEFSCEPDWENEQQVYVEVQR